MHNKLLWKMLVSFPPAGETISHLDLLEIVREDLLEGLREEDCRHEMPESLDGVLIDQIKVLEDRLPAEVKLEMRAGVYHVGWREPAANLPTMRDDAKSTRVDRDAWVGEQGCRSDFFRLRVSQSDVNFNF